MADNIVSSSASEKTEKVGIGAYVALIFAVILFSGVFYKMPEGQKWLGALDFTTLIGSFGTIADSKNNFTGSGGISARAGFLFSLNLIPGVMLAMGLIEVLAHYGALRAAQVLLTPLLKPLLGVPGYCGLALITDLQSTDGGAALTRQLKDAGDLNDTEVNIFASFQMTADACITNFFSSGAVLFTLTNADGELAVPVSLGLCLGVMLIGKVFAANLMRLLLIRSSKKAA